MPYTYRATLHFGVGNVGLGTNGIRATYVNDANVSQGTKDNGVLYEVGDGDYAYLDTAVPDAATGVKFTKISGGALLGSGTCRDPRLASADFNVDTAAVDSTVGYLASGILEQVRQLWRLFMKKATMTSTKRRMYNDAGDVILNESTVSDAGGTQTRDAAA